MTPDQTNDPAVIRNSWDDPGYVLVLTPAEFAQVTAELHRPARVVPELRDAIVRSADRAGEAQGDARLSAFAEVSRAMNLVADIWERDGSDPCRVRITREYANAYRTYAEALGEPTGSGYKNRALAAESELAVLREKVARVEALADEWEASISELDSHRATKDYAVCTLMDVQALRAALADPAPVVQHDDATDGEGA